MIRDRLKGRPRRLLGGLAVVLGAGALIAIGLMIYAFGEARRDPIVRRAELTAAHWPTGARPVTIALLSDLHLGNRSTNPLRLSRVVAQVNSLHPDLVLIAGDFIAGHKPVQEARAFELLQPLRQLRAPLGVVGVLGNHDYWAGATAVRSALTQLGVKVLMNGAVELGPIALGGVDDGFTGHDAVERVAAQLRLLAGARLVLTHSPQIVSRLPADAPLLLAGHTHCGQVKLPWIGSIDFMLRYGRYECGLVRDGERVTIVTAGVGTSVAPLRLGAPPDFWLLTLGPPRSGVASDALAVSSRATPTAASDRATATAKAAESRLDGRPGLRSGPKWEQIL